MYCSFATSKVPGLLSIGTDVLIRGTGRLVRRSKVALVESSDSLLIEGADDSVKDATVVEENKVIFAPANEDQIRSRLRFCQ